MLSKKDSEVDIVVPFKIENWLKESSGKDVGVGKHGTWNFSQPQQNYSYRTTIIQNP